MMRSRTKMETTRTTGTARMLNSGILVMALMLPCAFGYMTQTIATVGQTFTLKRVDNTGIQFILNSQIAPNLQSSVTGKTVFTASSNPSAAALAALAAWNGVTTANVHF